MSHYQNSRPNLHEPVSAVLEKVLETEVNVALERDSLVTSNKSRPPLSILPEDQKEKQKHVIKLVLEQFRNLSLKYSTGNKDYFDCLVPCPH
ncbi:20729_t:CDS:1, partial [Gigaspora margarita]